MSMHASDAADDRASADVDDPDKAEEDEAEESGPLRRCVVSRERAPKDRLIRFVVGPDRRVAPDFAERLPGRGIWLSARRDVLDNVRMLTGAFARAARGPVILPSDLSSVLLAGLSRRFGEALGLARRAGQAVAGFDKAREWVRDGRAALVVQASDGSLEERRRFLGGADMTVVAPLNGETLGGIFGRERVVHVAVAAGRLAERMRVDAGRIEGLSGVVPPAVNDAGNAGR